MKNFINEFFETVQKFPSNTAVVDKNGFYSYAELNRKSNFLAHCIIEKAKELGIDIPTLRAEGKNGIRIAVFLQRTKDFLVAVIGIIRAGCTVVPIDTEYPDERINFILEDSDACILITDKANYNRADNHGRQIIFIEDIVSVDKSSLALPEYNYSNPNLEYYIVYTSGSSGRPKGIIRTLTGSYNIIELLSEEYTSPECSTLCIAGFTFLASFIDLFPPLRCGAFVYIANEEERKNIYQLHDIIIRRHIKAMFMTSAVYQALVNAYGSTFLNLVIISGAKLQIKNNSSERLLEIYGSSEAGSPVYHWIRTPEDCKYIGKPAEHLGIFAYLLDENGKKIEEKGTPGELCIVSPYLPLGYNKSPEQTAAVFTDCPFRPGKKMCHTGDMASWAENGMLVYHGRKDRMIKIRGYRVELDEIENVMQNLPEIKESAVINVNINGADKIACYYSLTDKNTVRNADYFKSVLGEKLAEYMIPEYFIELEKIPRNVNGKKDYLNLKAFEIKTSHYIAPCTELEKKVCRSFAVILNLPEEKVGIDDDFFALGGDSINSMKLIKYLGLQELSNLHILQEKTPRAICRRYEELHKIRLSEMDRQLQNRMALSEEQPLTEEQLIMLDYQFYTPISTMWNMGFFCRIDNTLDIEKFTVAVNTVIKHHPILSSKLILNDDVEYRFKYCPESFTEIRPEEISEEELQQLKEKLIVPFIMLNSQLYVCRIFKTPSANYLFFNVHHIIADGISLKNFLKNLKKAYQGTTLEEDYIFLFLKETYQKTTSSQYKTWAEYIVEKYKEKNWTLLIPPDYNVRENKQDYILAGMPFTEEKFNRYLIQYKIRESLFSQTAAFLTLGKLTSSSNLCLYCSYSGRENMEKEAMFGYLLSDFPVVVQLNSSMPVVELYQTVDLSVKDSLEKKEFCHNGNTFIPGDETEECISFIYQPNIYTLDTSTELPLTFIELPNNYAAAQVLFRVEFLDNYGQCSLRVSYMSTRYERSTIERFVQEYMNIASKLLEANPNTTVGDILS